MFDFLTKIAAAANKEVMDKISELAPIIIIGLIWLFSAIAKVVAGKKGEQPQVGQKTAVKPGFENLINIVRQKYAEAQEQIRKESEQGAKRIEPPAQTSVERHSQPAQPRPATAPPQPPRYQYKQSFATGPMQSHGPRHMPPISSATMQRDKVIKPPLFEETIPAAQEEIDKPVPLPKEVKIAGPIHKIGPHQYMTELLKQYAEPEGLRKAFINYEIFGKPIALRDSLQSMF